MSARREPDSSDRAASTGGRLTAQPDHAYDEYEGDADAPSVDDLRAAWRRALDGPATAAPTRTGTSGDRGTRGAHESVEVRARRITELNDLVRGEARRSRRPSFITATLGTAALALGALGIAAGTAQAFNPDADAPRGRADGRPEAAGAEAARPPAPGQHRCSGHAGAGARSAPGAEACAASRGEARAAAPASSEAEARGAARDRSPVPRGGDDRRSRTPPEVAPKPAPKPPPAMPPRGGNDPTITHPPEVSPKPPAPPASTGGHGAQAAEPAPQAPPAQAPAPRAPPAPPQDAPEPLPAQDAGGAASRQQAPAGSRGGTTTRTVTAPP